MGTGQRTAVTLLERESETAALDELIAAVAESGGGRGVILAGPAGIGKTELLRGARERAAGAGLQVLAASGGELERELGLGIVRQLFEPVLVPASADERAELLQGPAAAVVPVLGLEGVGRGAVDEYAALNALYWLCVRLAERAPVMLAVDDAHWADATSLEWLAFLVRRLEGLPILAALARRTEEPEADDDLLVRIASEPLVETIRPSPLSPAAVVELVLEEFDDRPEDGFVAACHDAAGGNPLFARQLIAAAHDAGLRPLDVDAERVGALAPERVSQIVLDRLRRLSPNAIGLAEAAALLGSRAELRHAAALADLGERAASEAADELAAAGILRPGQPLEFAHPVLRASVYDSIPAARRASEHGRAARLLGEEGAAPARIAIHLLEAPPAADPWAAGVLRAAAAAEVLPEARAAYLRRAIAEPAPPDSRAEILLELGQAESTTHDVRAIEHLDEALRAAGDPVARGVAAVQLAWCQVEHDRLAEAERVLRDAIRQLPEHPGRDTPERDLQLGLEGTLLVAEQLTSGLTRDRLERAIALAGAGESAAELGLLGIGAMCAPAVGATAAEVADLAERALRDDVLLGAEDLMPIQCAVWALEFADRPEADGWQLRAQDEARRRRSPNQLMLAASARAVVSSRLGALADAEQDARAALDLARLHGREYSALASAAALVIALTEQGRLEEADDVVAGGEPEGARYDLSVYVYGRGGLRLAQGRVSEALEDFLTSGRLMQENGMDFPGFWPWRVGAATAHLGLGRREEARALAREQLDLVRPFGAGWPTGLALRALGLAEGGVEGLELLAGAVEELERSPATLDRAKALLELGAALRRAGRRADAREPLRRALDLADRCGAVPVAERAREELVTAGARPRRTRIGGVEALTAGELRVARRAAEGRTNREIAQDLFVTIKTVEKHLANAYGKLAIAGRDELAEALGAPA